MSRIVKSTTAKSTQIAMLNRQNEFLIHERTVPSCAAATGGVNARAARARRVHRVFRRIHRIGIDANIFPGRLAAR
jgi:hypothetical protein